MNRPNMKDVESIELRTEVLTSVQPTRTFMRVMLNPDTEQPWNGSWQINGNDCAELLACLRITDGCAKLDYGWHWEALTDSRTESSGLAWRVLDEKGHTSAVSYFTKEQWAALLALVWEKLGQDVAVS